MVVMPRLCKPICLWVVLLVPFLAATGCGRGRPRAPVTGKVMYQGQPLSFGMVMFQPAEGQPATGPIQPDGTFRMAIPGEGDGAAVGENKVRVMCFEAQDPSLDPAQRPEDGLGRALVPEKYMDYDTSGITFDVQPGANEPLLIELH